MMANRTARREAPASRFGQIALIILGTSLLIGRLFPWANAAEPSRGIPGSDQVSEQFRAQFDSARLSIPNSIWQGLAQSGWDIRLTRFLSDALPQLKHQQPRGWPNGRSWDSVEAVHLPETRTVIVAEHFRDRDGDPTVNRRLAGVLRHEVGHAFDMYAAGENGFVSSSSEFCRAYAADVARMNAEQRHELKYFLQRGKAGRQETFAEGFAIELGGGSDEPHREVFIVAFPRVLKHVRLAIGRYAPERNAVARRN